VDDSDLARKGTIYVKIIHESGKFLIRADEK
jgi:hypothetical protein